MPKAKCYVLDCKNRYEFAVPKRLRQASWLTAIDRPNDDPKPFNDTVRKRLRTTAIPSQNIPQGRPPKTPKTSLKELQDSSDRMDDNRDDLGVSILPPDDIHLVSSEDSRPISSVSCEEPKIMSEDEAESAVKDLENDPQVPESPVNDLESDSQVPDTESDVKIDYIIFGELECGSEVIVSPESDISKGDADKVGVSNVGKDKAEVCFNKNVYEERNSATEEEPPEDRTVKNPKQKYDIHDNKDRPEGVKYYTGLETYFKFMFVFQSLRTDIFPISYRDCQVKILSLVNQFFLTLWKLRRNTPDFELGDHFGISRATESNIFISMVSFMAEQWGKINVWLSRSLRDYYMPDSFKKAYPTTRGIIDGTECYLAKPSNPRFQQATFSTYKNANTVKVLVTGNPCGLISHTSPAYGGATCDRQIVERSPLIDMCQRGDSIMADRGFNVQDMFAPKGITINIPAFLKGKDHLPGETLMKDRKLARERVHIVRLIGLTKTYKILSGELDSH